MTPYQEMVGTLAYLNGKIGSDIIIIYMSDRPYYNNRYKVIKSAYKLYGYTLLDEFPYLEKEVKVDFPKFAKIIARTHQNATIFVFADYFGIVLFTEELSKNLLKSGYTGPLHERYKVVLHNYDNIPIRDHVIKEFDNQYMVSPFFSDYKGDPFVTEFIRSVNELLGNTDVPYLVVNIYEMFNYLIKIFSITSSMDVGYLLNELCKVGLNSTLGFIQFGLNHALNQRLMIGKLVYGDSSRTMKDFEIINEPYPIYTTRLSFTVEELVVCDWFTEPVGSEIMKDTLNIGVLLMVKKSYFSEVQFTIDGVHLALEKINGNGGLIEKIMNPLYCNCEDKPDSVKKCMEYFNKNEVNVVFGGQG